MIREDILTEIVELQRNWIIHLDTGIEREKFKQIKLSPNFALIISGIRRCGKSTLLAAILKNQKIFYYLNLEDPRLEGFELKDFNKIETVFKKKYGEKGVYFFDEIQNIHHWEKFIRYLIDKKEKVVITGSNASLLSKELGTKLTGRHLDLTLFPFSYSEFLSYNNMKERPESYNKYMTKGGFPEFLEEKNPEILNELLKDVIMRDVVNRYKIRNPTVINKIALYLISNVGKEFSYNSLKKVFKMSVQTIIDYISYLEDSFILFTVPKFDYSYRKQQVNPKKIYSIDNGLSNLNTISFSKDKGRMLENSVFLHLRRKHNKIYYFKEKGECDFIVKKKDKIQAIQVCFNLNEENMEREMNGLIEALKFFNLKEGLILTYEQEDVFVIEGKKIIAKPAWKWLLS